MKIGDFKILTDENVHRKVVAYLRGRGFDVSSVSERGMSGAADVDVIRHAVVSERLVLTHDRDFGTLSVVRGEPVVGIIYLRPGSIDPQFTVETIEAILKAEHEVAPPFILVGERVNNRVNIRIRPL